MYAARNTMQSILSPLLIFTGSLLVGCASTPPTRPTVTSVTPEASGVKAEPDTQLNHPIPVVRNGRYTLVELMPDDAPSDLMQQLIDVTIPKTVSGTVAQAMRYVLVQSGYHLCAERDDMRLLEIAPLPAMDLHLGPMTLRNGLKTLLGPHWDLEVDDTTREVCASEHQESLSRLLDSIPLPLISRHTTRQIAGTPKTGAPSE